MMLFHLVKKDFILAKKYLLFILMAAIGMPVFIHTRIGYMSGGFLDFVITVLLVVYLLFNTVSMAEDKYRGAALLCATPYTRNAVVKAKYLFILIVFLCCYILYAIIAWIVPIDMKMLDISTVGISLLVTAMYFGVMIPVQYRFGYEKTKYISNSLIFITPFVFPTIIKQLQSNNIHLRITLPFPQMMQDLIPCFIALVMGFISMMISVSIYSKKNL